MSTKKTKTNGAVEAPVPAIFEEAAVTPQKNQTEDLLIVPLKNCLRNWTGQLTIGNFLPS